MEKTTTKPPRDWRKFLLPHEAAMVDAFDVAIAELHVKSSDFARQKESIRRRCMQRARYADRAK